jgi:hypothetical protein
MRDAQREMSARVKWSPTSHYLPSSWVFTIFT